MSVSKMPEMPKIDVNAPILFGVFGLFFLVLRLIFAWRIAKGLVRFYSCKKHT